MTTKTQKITFSCYDCNKDFKSNGHDNPVFFADKVANCPICDGKCWEKEIKITLSEYNKLKKAYKAYNKQLHFIGTKRQFSE